MFKKYPDIENTYRQKEIDFWLDKNPDLKDETFIIQEKIDGCNFSVIITKDNISFGKRTSLLTEDESLYGWQETVKKYNDFFIKIQNSITDGTIITLFGELFGKGIQSRIEYCQTKQILFFDVYINFSPLTPEETYSFFIKHKAIDLTVPSFGIIKGLQNAMDFNTKDVETQIVNTVPPKGLREIEGIVIKPYNKIYSNPLGEIFYLKKKNEAFLEVKKVKREQKDINPALLNLQNLYDLYLTENRLIGIFSKNGMIETAKDIGKYIKLMLEDASKDFLKDYSELYEVLPEKEKKQVFSNTGKVVGTLIMEKYL